VNATALLSAPALGWLLTPFLSGLVVQRSARARAAVARHLAGCLFAGWLGVAALVWGATALGQPAGVVAFVLGGPLAGLSFWTSAPEDGGDDGGGGGGPPGGWEPGPPGWDWERFARDLEDYERERLAGTR